MKKFFKPVIQGLVAAALTVPSPAVWAAGGRSQTALPTSTTTTNTGSTSDTGTSTTTTTTGNTTQTITTTSSTPGTTNVNTYIDTSAVNAQIAAQEASKKNNTVNQGKDAGSAQNMGMLAGLAGAAFSTAMAVRACTPKKPDPSCPAWIMGALASAAIAAAMAAAKKKSNQTVTDVSSTTPDPVDPQTESRLVETNRNIAEIAKNVGMTVNPKTSSLRLADGRTIKASDVGNPAALAAAGLSSSEIAAMQDAAKKAMKEGAKVAAKGLDAGGAGNGEALTVGSGAGKSQDEADANGLAGNSGSLSREPAQIQGLTKDYNGNPIGVASENLFTLINRRYDHLAGQNSLRTQ